MSPPEALTFSVGEEAEGERLDVGLSALAGQSRAQVRRWIDAGRVSVNGLVSRASLRLTVGDEIEAIPPELLETKARPEDLPLDIVYEDSDLVVVDKAAGMVVHPAPGHASGTLVNALLHHCVDLEGVGGELRPGIVHRLDKGTTGILVVAKNDTAHRLLSDQFRCHDIERVYCAFVRGVPQAEEGRVDRAIGRHPRDRKRMSVASRAGRSAVTAWRVIRRFPTGPVSELEVRPETGRTHQIRVHLSSAGMPLVGDPLYGRGRRRGGSWGLDRPALHASVLGFTHPGSGDRVRFEAPLPADLVALTRRLEAAEKN